MFSAAVEVSRAGDDGSNEPTLSVYKNVLRKESRADVEVYLHWISDNTSGSPPSFVDVSIASLQRSKYLSFSDNGMRSDSHLDDLSETDIDE